MVENDGHVAWVPRDKGPNVIVNMPSLDALLSDMRAHFAGRRGFSLATLNLDHVVKLRDDPAFRSAYQAQSHVTADGNPIVWLSRLARQPVSLLAGADLIAPLAQLAGEMDVPIGLLGSTEETLQAAADALQMEHAGLRVVTCIAPPMGFDPTGELADRYIAQLEDAGVAMCFLALGAPKQEMFAAHAMSKTDRVGFVSIGAGLDFIAGTQIRAPKFVRAIAAEWVWRLMTNPRRLAARYAACIMVMPGLLRSALRARRANGG
ncbi:WecB/TagA/CpsF family glycosyltransferase [Cognatiyoonia sp. IB215182]|uniref:WecB/TagA/CpsF family glycosyltransferase n=1 Tax=Cognatiyoonia sp. IB215182 TaxID=3097353 RepID=UPI002A167DF4|nr:WecB/TagA/CpsF family glycosyltransferase [Cognatiyoonia sp. IB215182]MDX8353120.1 WecB/TagA/CpsF family glycosyltransferase [Cognatiyoonia sp. IB215182]